MASGFNPILAFGSGLASGIESAETAKRAKQDKIDDEYRKRAIDLNYETELYSAKKKIDDQEAQTSSSNMDSILKTNKQNSTNQAQYDALKQAQQSPAISQDTSVTGSATPPPTNTPQTAVTSTNTPQSPAQGGMNSPQGGPVPLQTSVSTPNQTPQQGDATNPLQAPSQQQPQPVDNSTGTVYPNQKSDIVSTYNNTPLTREDAAAIKGYAAEEKAKSKGYLKDEDAVAVGYTKWKDEKAKQNKTGAAWTGGQDEITKANTLGVPYVQDKQFQQLDAKTQFDIKEADTKRLFGSQDEQRDIAKIPVLANDLKTLYQLNQAITTGNVKALPGGVSLASATDSYNALYEKITNVIAILSRAPGLGRMSVAELTADQKGFASLKVPNAANNSILLTKLAISQRKAEQVEYQKQVLSANGHYDDGVFDNIWDKYDKANPVLDLSNPLQPKVLDYTPRNEFMRGNDNAKTNILADTGSFTHNLNTPQETKPKVVTVDKSGKTTFDFSGY